MLLQLADVRIRLGKPVVAQLLRNVPAFYETRYFIIGRYKKLHGAEVYLNN
jgi:hypothetical protein